ncbi:MAG: SH3 domain-containing protein, partial [Chloroflexi bacterium]|nr:SH3 domain-containing protein [Chloroflexota bacterium]
PTATRPPASGQVQVQATSNVWCRSGPALYYDALASLQPGDRVEVLGQYHDEARGAYWLVRTPQGITCWLPSRYTTVAHGDPTQMPWVTPPPPPPVAFLVGIERISRCRDRRGLTLWIRNEGTRVLESVDVKIEGPGQAYTYTIGLDQRNGFEWWLNCEAGARVERLLPGETGLITIATPGRELSGEPLTVTIKACTENNLQGQCLERRLWLPVP